MPLALYLEEIFTILNFKRLIKIFDDFYKIAEESRAAAKWLVGFSKDFINKENLDFVYVFSTTIC